MYMRFGFCVYIRTSTHSNYSPRPGEVEWLGVLMTVYYEHLLPVNSKFRAGIFPGLVEFGPQNDFVFWTCYSVRPTDL